MRHSSIFVAITFEAKNLFCLRRRATFKPPQLSRLLLLVVFAISTVCNGLQQRQRHSFREKCVEEHDKNLLSCTVSSVDCSVNMEKLFPPPASGNAFPAEAHDLRIEPFTKAAPLKVGGGAFSEAESGTDEGEAKSGSNYQLLVDISWQTPPNNSTRALKGFLLEIEGENGRKHACFLLNVSNTDWNAKAIAASPRLHFSSDSLFNFAQTYQIELYSLPERNIGSGASVQSRFTTPNHPSGGAGSTALHPQLVSANCTKFANQFASKWTAGFRHIYVHSAARILQVEFVGAPPQFCFEQYEVRLLDETGLELLYSGSVSVEEMNRNGTMLLGNYNFTDLEYDKSYIPSVIPVERAADGRCLCPVFGTDPYDATVVCSCVAADWLPIRMTRPDVLKLCPGCPSLNDTLALLSPPVHFENESARDKNGTFWLLLLLLNALFLLLVLLLVFAYLRCRLYGSAPYKNQFRRIRFVPNTATTTTGDGGEKRAMPPKNGCSPPGAPLSASSSLAVRTNLALGTVSSASCNSSTSPLIGATNSLRDSFEEEAEDELEMEGQAAAATAAKRWPQLSLLIVYAHDCELHERAVMALAEFLRDCFGVVVKLDRWDTSQIDANLTDWLSASVVSADKVLVVNSAGAWERYRAKISSHGRLALERKNAGLLDGLFLAHIDMALQHHSVISARFGYSKADQTLPLLQGRLQYILPDNICPLISAIFGRNARQDERLAPQTLAECQQFVLMKECVLEMENLMREKPNWLAESHRQILVEPNLKKQTKIASSLEGEERAAEVAKKVAENDTMSEQIEESVVLEPTSIVVVGSGVKREKEEEEVLLKQMVEEGGGGGKTFFDRRRSEQPSEDEVMGAGERSDDPRAGGIKLDSGICLSHGDWTSADEDTATTSADGDAAFCGTQCASPQELSLPNHIAAEKQPLFASLVDSRACPSNDSGIMTGSLDTTTTTKSDPEKLLPNGVENQRQKQKQSHNLNAALPSRIGSGQSCA